MKGAITFALILQKFRLRQSYTCAHKSDAFALSFGVTLARIFSQFFLGQLLVFEPRCKNIGFPTWSDTNHAIYPQMMARGLEFRI